ncbi:type 4a pilus biogenesis protein PilO [Methylococcus capsulatus]|uniref:Type 4 fimbrial biogenesis protein PilO n=1 Tax=Methylococcus capsulatus (strain ATCC 33009 / NCIMB 11132 / Bath) TaxID=243233 RepID=Q60BY6_METCA|nr:type 4a pilus biogenesis protein PilO [Methylococcus capsulatus]AAU90404.1 type 4 fimbrial biogenesis protein PilO [Methylococcus capsulatus str. Bath]QXP88844.1 type 4a pilus biogenesis protein PilO [Methylococcus capsulatus]QXP94122.1 type 4a pilus biogenesis protein PilO [Methylococcus capsulatus]UQN11135.1 type 4a pilus biogenesis protein PilO [Methylococcus capsulatus]
MNLAKINWDLEYAGSWPTPVKLAVIAVLSTVLAGVWYYLDTRTQLAGLEDQQRREQELKETFEIKQKKAVNLEEYKLQLADIEKTFGDLLRQLPDRTQVPDLLVDVSQTGLASGLEFELFKPGGEVSKEFYAELPIEIRVVGTYMEFGAFVSGLASLPRIVTVHNVKIVSRSADGAGPKPGEAELVMTALVKTYRYLDDGAVPSSPADRGRR